MVQEITLPKLVFHPDPLTFGRGNSEERMIVSVDDLVELDVEQQQPKEASYAITIYHI